MFIQTEPTPNPATLKFIPGKPVLSSGVREFKSPEEAGISPLAARLFEIEGVKGVFLGADFVSVTKSDDIEWELVKPAVLGTIMEHFMSGAPVMEGDAPGINENEVYDEADKDIVDEIKTLLEKNVRPVVARDGGDIVFQGFRDGIVYLHMRGACSGCPSSTATLKDGIEKLLKHYIPEVKSVEQA